MKINDADVGFHSKGVQSSSSYRVAQSAKVMDMFSNMLYSNKIRAVIRELSTNAWDAHLMAGNDKEAPTIHLPSPANPQFKIRDYGVGMSKEQLEEMYQTYGASNKTHSNEFNGCMGIGSKSPFAYAAMFTTTSYYNGKKYVYVNAKGKDGVPSIKLMVEEKTNERNGLEISFAVNVDDCVEFVSEAQSILRWFPVPFDVRKAGTPFEVDKSKYIIEKDTWKIREYSYYDRTSFVVMGNVAYPVEVGKFDYDKSIMTEQDKTAWYSHYSSKDKKSRGKSFYTDLLNLGLELHLDTGAVEMDISREGLQYTKHTIDSIRKKLDEISLQVADEMTQNIATSDCLWSAATKFKELSSGSYRSLRQFVDMTAVVYKGKPVPESFKVTANKHYKLYHFQKDRYSKKPTRWNNVTDVQVASSYPDSGGGSHFLIGDKKVGTFVASERFMENNLTKDGKPKYTNLYLVSLEYPSDRACVKKAVDAIKADFGCLDEHISFASDVAVPKGVSKKGCTEKLFKFASSSSNSRRGYSNGNKNYWTSDSVNIAAGGYYVELNNWHTTNVAKPNLGSIDKHSFSSHDLSDLVTIMEEFGINVPDIYGVKTVSVKRFEKDSGWDNFFNYARKEIKSYIDKSKIKEQIKDIDEYSGWGDREFYYELCKTITPKQKESDTILHKTLDKLKEMDKINKKWGKKIQKIRKICRNMEIDFSGIKSKNTVTWEKVGTDIDAAYPVTALIGRWDFNYKTKIDSIAKVVNIIDACNS